MNDEFPSLDFASFHVVPPLPYPQPPLSRLRCLRLKWSKALDRDLIKTYLYRTINETSTVEHLIMHEIKPLAIVIVPSHDDAVNLMTSLSQGSIPGTRGFARFGVEMVFPAKSYLHSLGMVDVPSAPIDSLDTVINGLILVNDYVTEQEEAAIIHGLDHGTIDTFDITSSLNIVESVNDNVNRCVWKTTRSRCVAHFGYEFNYNTVSCDGPSLGPLPPLFQNIAQRIARDFPCICISNPLPNQATVNSYLPGQGIASHVDTHSAFEDGLYSLSLGSQTVMEFRRLRFCHANVSNADERLLQNSDGQWEKISIYLPRRSLVVMSKASRYEWEHGIMPRKNDLIDGHAVPRDRRVSVTFRTLRNRICECDWPKQCDSFASREAKGPYPSSLYPSPMELQFVHQFYDTVGDHFSRTRYAPWPKVKEFLSSLPKGSLIADVGCGNGKYMIGFNPNNHIFIGCDYSQTLTQICVKERQLSVIRSDCLSVSMRGNIFDCALSIAVLHHLSTHEHRIFAIREAFRLLKPCGLLLIYAWAHEQAEGSKHKFPPHLQDVMVAWHYQQLPDAEDVNNKSDSLNFSGGRHPSNYLATLSSDQSQQTFQRYCHLYRKGELRQLTENANLDNFVVVDDYYDEGNWAIILKKK